MKAPGITIRPIPMSNGWDSHLNQVFYDEVRIPLDQVVGGVNNGWSVAMSTLAIERGPAFLDQRLALIPYVDGLIDRAQACLESAAILLVDDANAAPLRF